MHATTEALLMFLSLRRPTDIDAELERLVRSWVEAGMPDLIDSLKEDR